MKIKDYKNLMPKLVKSGIVPFVWGKHGIGKTEIHKQIATQMGLELIYLTFGAVEDVGDIIGLMDFDEYTDADGIKHKKVSHVAPDWFPTTGNKLIFIDEFNRAKPQILQAMYPFVLEGKLHTHQLPDNCYVVVAGNPPTDGYDVTDTDDSALMSRFCHVELLPSPDEWLDYESRRGGNFNVISYFRGNKDLLDAKEKDFDLRSVVRHDRRNASKLSDFMNTEPTETEARDVACGLLGPELGLKFITHMKDLRAKLDGREILDTYSSNTQEKIKRNIKEIDLLNKALEDTLGLITEPEKLTKTQLTNLERFLHDLPNDLAWKGVNELLRKGDEVILQTIGESKSLLKKFEYTDAKK